MICAMAALTMLATACKDKGEQFEINGRIAEAVGKTHAQAEELAFDIVTGRASAADVARFDVAGGAAGAASGAASSVASTMKEA